MAGLDLQPGTLVGGKYRVERKLGEGGMGVVYAAHHQALDVKVALKILRPAVAKDPLFVERFLQEARSAAKIEGEHIARVKDVGTFDDGVPFMVMEILVGEDLGALLERTGSLEPGVAVAYVLQALSGVAEAHELGVVHRDLKPSNLFVVRRKGRPDKVKVLDFGISKSFVDTQAGQITTTGVTLGSPAYMSPEQVRSSKNVDARADVWSMGVILYELLTGRLPFEGDSVGGVFAAILEKEPRPPHELRPEIPEALSAVVMGCLRRNAADRIQSATALIAALSPFATAVPTSAGPPSTSLPELSANASFDPMLAASNPDVPKAAVHTQATWAGNRSIAQRTRWIGASVAGALVAVVAFVGFKMVTSQAPAPASAVPIVQTVVVTVTASAPLPHALSVAAPSVSVVASVPTASTPKPSAAPGAKKPPPKPSASTDESVYYQRH